MTYKEVINKWKLNQVLLASLIKMPNGTFKNKFSDNQTAYNFSLAEEQLIVKGLKELANDIMKIDHENKPVVKDLNKNILGEKQYKPKTQDAPNLTYLQKRQQQKLK